MAYTANTMRVLWTKALVLGRTAEKQGKEISRTDMQSLLKVGGRTASHLAWALKYRSVLNCQSEELETGASEIELSLGDLHVPYYDPACLDVILEYAETLKPTIITLMGDMLDFYRISNFNKNPLRSKRIADEIKQLRTILYDIRNRFPNARIIYYEGNHEARLERYICSNANELVELVDTLLQDKLELEKLKIEYINRPFRIGKLWHLHGHEKPAGINNPEYILNTWIQYIFDHFIIFHYHRTQDKVFKRIDGDVWTAHAIGYVAGDMDYAIINKWNQGFAVIEYEENGNFRVHNKKVLNGVIY